MVKLPLPCRTHNLKPFHIAIKCHQDNPKTRDRWAVQKNIRRDDAKKEQSFLYYTNCIIFIHITLKLHQDIKNDNLVKNSHKNSLKTNQRDITARKTMKGNNYSVLRQGSFDCTFVFLVFLLFFFGVGC